MHSIALPMNGVKKLIGDICQVSYRSYYERKNRHSPFSKYLGERDLIFMKWTRVLFDGNLVHYNNAYYRILCYKSISQR